MNNSILAALLLLTFSSSIACGEDELLRASMLSQHGLIEEAKVAYINLLFSSKEASVKAKCLYELGLIALEEKEIGRAIKTWRTLLDEFPDSEEAKSVEDRIEVLSLRLEELLFEYAEDEEAADYMDNGDFFSNRIRDNAWGIDTSFLKNEEMALHWYDKVLTEFPKTNAAHIAYIRTFKTLVGTSGRRGGGFKAAVYGGGDYGDYGNQKEARNYVVLMVLCLEDYLRDFPEGSFANRMRYQIGQAHWALNDHEKASFWLKKVVEHGQGEDDFYVYMAKQRLEKLGK